MTRIKRRNPMIPTRRDLSTLPPAELADELSNARTRGMVMHYEFGRGCRKIARIYGVSDHEVYDRLKAAKVKMRPCYQSHTGKKLPKKTFNGATYTLSTKGYWRRTDGGRTMLHHDVWEYHCGPIPEGYDIWHLDKDPHNNKIDNLACMTRAEGSAYCGIWKPRPVKHCLWCGQELHAKWMATLDRWESVYAMNKRLYCNPQCAKSHATGKPRGWSPRRELEAQR